MLESAKEGFQKALHHLDLEFSRIQMGRANPMLVEDVMVEQYGALQALKNIATVGTLDAQTLSIKPWDKTTLNPIAKAITESGKGLNPQTMADSIMIKIPALTEERRVEMTKVVKKLAEEAKVAVRNVRGESLRDIKKSEEAKEISEDDKKDFETELQKQVQEANGKIDDKMKKKTEDIMKV